MILRNSNESGAIMNREIIRTYANAGIGIILLLIHYNVTNDLFMFLFLMYASFIIFFSKFNNSIIYLLIYSNFMEVIYFSFSGINFYFILLFVFISKTIGITNSYKKRILIYFILFIFSVLISYDSNVTDMIPANLILISSYLCIIMIASNIRRICLAKCILGHSVGLILSSFLGMFSTYIPKLYAVLDHEPIYGLGREFNRFSGISYDTNIYAFFCIVTIALLMVISKSKKYQKICYLFSFILLIFGLATFSKMFIVILTLLIVYYLLFVIKLKPIKLFGLLVILYLCYTTVRSIIGLEYYNVMIARFGVESYDLSDITTNRSILWSNYIKEILSSPKNLFLGVGINHESLGGFASHNTYLQIIYMIGITGFTFFTLFLISFYRLLPKTTNLVIINALPIITLFLSLSSLSMFTNNVFWIILFLSIATLSYKNDLNTN